MGIIFPFCEPLYAQANLSRRVLVRGYYCNSDSNRIFIFNFPLLFYMDLHLICVLLTKYLFGPLRSASIFHLFFLACSLVYLFF